MFSENRAPAKAKDFVASQSLDTGEKDHGITGLREIKEAKRTEYTGLDGFGRSPEHATGSTIFLADTADSGLILDGSSSVPMPDSLIFDECPENERIRYISRIKKFDAEDEYQSNYEQLGGLYSFHQGMAQEVHAADRLTHRDSYIDQALGIFEKSTFSQIIADELGHRPAAVSFDPEATDGSIPDSVIALVESSDAVYLKQDKSAKGNRVIRVAKTEEGFSVKDVAGEMILEDLHELDLPKPERSLHASWIAESEIPTARTADGKTWEVRFLPPHTNHFAKIGDSEKHINNIAKGGSRGNSYTTALDAIMTCDPEIDPAEAFQKATDFVQRGFDLSNRVKSLADAIQVGLAKKIITPEDMHDPEQYDAVMEDAFAGSFFCVDVTGIWDDETKTLVPMIIEAQPEAGMPQQMVRDIYPVSKDESNRKRALLQSALK